MIDIKIKVVYYHEICVAPWNGFVIILTKFLSFGVASDENIDITKFPVQHRNAVILLKHKLNLTLFMLGCCEEK